jgi:hypothetical protein
MARRSIGLRSLALAALCAGVAACSDASSPPPSPPTGEGEAAAGAPGAEAKDSEAELAEQLDAYRGSVREDVGSQADAILEESARVPAAGLDELAEERPELRVPAASGEAEGDASAP